MLLRKMFIVLAITVLLITSALAAEVLNDRDLARVNGAGIEFSLDGQGLVQDVQQPDQQGLASNPDPQVIEAMDEMPSVFVVLESRGDIGYHRALNLTGHAQISMLALSLDNSYASDVVAMTNVFDGVLIVPEGIHPRLNISQGSEVYQLYRQQGEIYSSLAGYHYEKLIEQWGEYEQGEAWTDYRLEQNDRQKTFRQTSNLWDVGVGKVSLSDLIEGGTSVTLIDQWEHKLINGFNLDATVDLGWLGTYGGAASYDGLTLYGPYASYDGLDLIGDDLLVEATLELPSLDFGDVILEGCIYDCAEVKIDLGKIGGTNLFTVMEKIDNAVAPDDFISFTEDGILLQGLGSLLPDELNMNTGFVFSGNGHFGTVDTARVKIGAEANFGLGTELTFTIDLSTLDSLGLIKDFLGANKWTYVREDQLIDITIPITFVDFEVPPFYFEFDGIVIAQLGDGEVSVKELEYEVADFSFHDNSRYEESYTRDFGSSSFNKSVEHSEFTGGQLTDGEAELIAMSEGKLFVDQGSDVNLSDFSQRGMSVMHGVNAVASVTANSVNVGKIPDMNRNISQVTLQQRNQFVQQR